MKRTSADFEAVFPTNVGLVNLDGRALAAHRRKGPITHRLSNAMGQKPGGLHATRKHSLDLAGRNALLAGAHKVDHLQPKAQRKVRALKDSSLSNGELPLAFVAIVKAKASCVALHLAEALRVSIATVRANWPVWPKLALDIRESGGFIVEAGIVKGGFGHGRISYGLNATSWGSLCQV